jgi:predicted nucleic acid-binding protein
VIVIDASVALAWVIEDSEEHRQYSAAILAQKLEHGNTLAAPGLMSTEVAYKLLKLGRSRRFSEAKIAEQAEMVDLFIDLTYDLESRAASLVRFAVRHNVQGYDAVYLALAMHLDAPLATLDSGLRAAARRAKVALA